MSMKNSKLDWFNSHISCSESTNILKTCILNSLALVVSDESYYPIEKVGACAWNISTPDGKEWVEGGGIIPGLCKDQNSYRANLGGS